MKRRETGIIGEKIACEFLRNNGFKIVETNYRCRDGEIDIIASLRDTLVFVEVRTKKDLMFGTPEESITWRKMEKLNAVANHYRQNHDNLPLDWRIDVIAICIDRDGKVNRIELIENAIEDVK